MRQEFGLVFIHFTSAQCMHKLTDSFTVYKIFFILKKQLVFYNVIHRTNFQEVNATSHYLLPSLELKRIDFFSF